MLSFISTMLKINFVHASKFSFLQLSKKSFPLCMQNIHLAMKSNHHLRHGSRLQYGLFLKGIGLPLDEALKLFRTEFTKSMDVDTVSFIVWFKAFC